MKKMGLIGTKVHIALLSIAFVAFLGGNIVFNNSTLFAACKFILFMLTDVLIPGLVITEKIKNAFWKKEMVLPVSLGIGLVKVWLEYFVTIFAGTEWLQTAFIGLIDIIFIILYVRQRRKAKGSDGDKRIFSSIPTYYAIGILIIEFWAVCMRGMLPVKRLSSRYYIDIFYWIGNAISLKNGFPPTDFRCVGAEYKYHYFSSLILAEISKLTGIDIVELCLFYSPLIVTVLLVYGMYALLRTKIANKKLIAWLMLVGLLTEGNISYITHLYLFSFGFDYGIAFGILAVILLVILIEHKQDKWSLKIAFLATVFIFFSVGCKGPVGLVILIGFGCLSLWYLTQGRIKAGIVSGMLWLGGFCAAFFGFIYGNVSQGTAKLYIWGAKTVFFKMDGYGLMGLYDKLVSQGIPSLVSLCIALVVSLFQRNYIIVTLFVIVAIEIIRRIIKKQEVLLLITLEMIGAWGIALTFNTIQSGGSQIYFMMSGYFAIVLAGGIALDSIYFEKVNAKKCLMAFLVALSLVGAGKAYAVISDKVLEGIAVVKNENYDTLFPYQTISKRDYDTAIWMKNHLPEKAIIATDLSEADSEIPNWIMGVFAEHFIWNSGEYAADTGEAERRKTLVHEFIDAKEVDLKQEGVSYFLETKNLKENGNYGELIYENDQYRIWKLVDN